MYICINNITNTVAQLGFRLRWKRHLAVCSAGATRYTDSLIVLIIFSADAVSMSVFFKSLTLPLA